MVVIVREVKVIIRKRVIIVAMSSLGSLIRTVIVGVEVAGTGDTGVLDRLGQRSLVGLAPLPRLVYQFQSQQNLIQSQNQLLFQQKQYRTRPVQVRYRWHWG